MNDAFELLILVALCVGYFLFVVRPYLKDTATQRDAPIGARVLVIARMLVFVALYSAALLLAIERFAPPQFYNPGRTVIAIAAVVAAVEIVWGPPGEAEWAGAMRVGLAVCKFTLLGATLPLILYGAYLSMTG